MLNPDERCRLGSASADWLVEEYDIKTILDKWEQLLLGLTIMAQAIPNDESFEP